MRILIHLPLLNKSKRRKRRGIGVLKRGAPKGHKGVTRPTPYTMSGVEVTVEICEKCSNSNLKEKGITRKTIEEMPPRQKSRLSNLTGIITVAMIVVMISRPNTNNAHNKADLV